MGGHSLAVDELQCPFLTFPTWDNNRPFSPLFLDLLLADILGYFLTPTPNKNRTRGEEPPLVRFFSKMKAVMELSSTKPNISGRMYGTTSRWCEPVITMISLIMRTSFNKEPRSLSQRDSSAALH